MSDQADTWAIVELMGHVRLAGKLTEEEKFGAKMGRLDIPAGGEPERFVTQLFGGGSVYRITYVTETVARDVCSRHSPAPVSPWDYPKLPLKTADDDDDVIDPSWELDEDDERN